HPARARLVRSNHWQPIEGAPVIGDRVLAYAVQPADDLAHVASRVELLHRAHEDLCRQVFGVGRIPDARIDEPIDRYHLGVVDLLEAAATRCGVRIWGARGIGVGRHLLGSTRRVTPVDVRQGRGRRGASRAAISSRKMRSVSSKAAGSVASMSISPTTNPSARIGTTISLRVLAKQARYRGSSFTSSTTCVWPDSAAAPQIPVPMGMRVCSVASGPIQGPSRRSVPLPSTQ